MLDWLDKIVKIAGAIAVLGYIALRAQFNLLGLSTVASLSLQQYLIETFRLVSYCTLVITPVLVVSALMLSMLAPFGRHPTRLSRLRARLGSFAISVASSSLLTVVFFVLFLWTLRILSKAKVDLAIGSLVAFPIDRSAGDQLCGALCIICFLGIVWVGWALRQALPTLRHKYSWTAAALMLAILTLQIPVLYGYSVEALDYPIVLASSKDGAHAQYCGVLILPTETELYLWSAQSRNGRIIQLARSETPTIISVGHTNLAEVLQDPGKLPDSYYPKCEMTGLNQ